MKFALPTVLALMLVASVSVADDAKDKAESKDKKKVKTEVHKFRTLELTVPTTWEKKKPSNNLRLGQYTISMGKDDKDPAELTIFNFPGGANLVRANLERWVSQFESNGRKAVMKKGKGAKGPYFYAAVTGSYKKPIGPPIRRQSKTMTGYQMMAVIVPTEKDGDYYLKMVGPAKTVTAQLEAFRAAFGGKKDSEIDYELQD